MNFPQELGLRVRNLGNGFGRIIHHIPEPTEPKSSNRNRLPSSIASVALPLLLAACGAQGATPDTGVGGGISAQANTVFIENPPTPFSATPTLAANPDASVVAVEPPPLPPIATPTLASGLPQIGISPESGTSVEFKIEQQRQIGIFRAEFDRKTGSQWMADQKNHIRVTQETDSPDFKDNGRVDNAHFVSNGVSIALKLQELASDGISLGNYDPNTTAYVILQDSNSTNGHTVISGPIRGVMALANGWTKLPWCQQFKEGANPGEVYVVDSSMSPISADWVINVDPQTDYMSITATQPSYASGESGLIDHPTGSNNWLDGYYHP